MKIRVLGCSGAIAKGCRTTSFLVNHNILVDAGTGVGDLTLEEMVAIDHVFLTHSHLDHIAALPLVVDSVAALRTQPVQVYALQETLAALRAHVFNNIIWPDFTRIPSAEAPFLELRPVSTGDIITVGGATLEVLPALHTVPAVGYAVEGERGWWVFSGDTGRNPAFWERVNQLPVAMLVIETAFSSRERALAERSRHLCPETLAQELAQFHCVGDCVVYITHTKPSETGLIYQEVCEMEARPSAGDGGGEEAGASSSEVSKPHDIRWLQAGQAFEV